MISGVRGRRPKPLDQRGRLMAPDKVERTLLLVPFQESAAGEGVEPSHTEPESAVLPLDDPAMLKLIRCLCRLDLGPDYM